MTRPRRDANSQNFDCSQPSDSSVLPMPPGYKPPPKSLSPSDSPDSHIGSQDEWSQCSLDDEIDGSQEPYSIRPHQFGHNISNDWNFYASDTSSSTNISSSHAHTHPRPLHPNPYIPTPNTFTTHTSDPRDPLPLVRNETTLTVFKEKKHLEHKVIKLERKVASLEGELKCAHTLYQELLDRLNSLSAGGRGPTISNPFLDLLQAGDSSYIHSYLLLPF
ncbi:hypothetical protein BV22DRAFT_1134020 [Leucogyrophana mollusca]|uniref:Uncharacterized protein n=1 Tax=Leucogyrophana mollusca TaxID=85980 RepID=A0ACB8B0V9_9AGAM|nr:hypothetical protein BV22DRAFT_1134020 [Leucogyrophana mollusca]